MVKSEAKFQILFKHWLQANWNQGSAAFELKRTLTNRFPVRNIAPHQLAALNNAAHGSLYYKIPDDSVGQKPMDCFVLQKSLAYIVIAFGPHVRDFFLIPIDTWNALVGEKKSVTSEEVGQWSGVIKVTVPNK